jgi:hypothetical protein
MKALLCYLLLVSCAFAEHFPEIHHLSKEKHLIHEFTGSCSYPAMRDNPLEVKAWLEQTSPKGAIFQPSFTKIYLGSHNKQEVKPALLQYIDKYAGAEVSYAHPGNYNHWLYGTD